MSRKIRADVLVTSFCSFHNLRKVIRSHVSCRQRACTHGQIENDQLANQTCTLSKLCYKIVLYKPHKFRDLLDARK